MTYADALAVLHTFPRFADAGAAAYQPGLKRMHALLDAMGQPHERFTSIHIAGTNGKGSTASFTAAIATAAGYRVGLHTSPHLFDFAERMRLNGRPASHEWIAATVAHFQPAFDRIGPSFFEASVALSFLCFAEEAVDLAVVEVGLGGRLDATNVLTPVACGITHIGLDHTDLLGSTLAAIAREKAGIAKPGVPLLSAVADEAARDAIRTVAGAAGARFEDLRETADVRVTKPEPAGYRLDVRTPLHPYEGLLLGLAGAHQVWNAALAVRLAEVALPDLAPTAVRAGLADVVALSGLHGRAEVWQTHPRIVADVAHNPAGWEAALATATLPSGGRLFVLVGVMADKDVETLARLLADAHAVVLPIGLPSSRALSREDLTLQFKANGLPLVRVEDAAAAIAWYQAQASTEDVLLITGSHLTVEVAKDAWPGELSPS